MELVEIRDLDGPNMFAPIPLIKLEVCLTPGETLPADVRDTVAQTLGVDVGTAPVEALLQVIPQLHAMCDVEPQSPFSETLDREGHIAVCYPWQHRSIGRGIARAAFFLLSGEISPEDIRRCLADAIESEHDPDLPEQPTWLRDTERRIPAIAVTGTNGKTTTTRLLAHIMSCAGHRPGWSSSSGVYINGTQVISGDYSGHSGARRVLTDPDVDCGILETARGGILLRGLGYESNDVGVFLNVSADHLGLHGVTRLETLARVKGATVRATKPEGVAVLNADDPLVLAQMPDIRARIILTSQNPANYEILKHMNAGNTAIVLEHGVITRLESDASTPLVPVNEIPITYRGIARHMVENALCACAAAMGFGIDQDSIIEGLRTFLPDRQHNAGRLNVFHLRDITVVVDFAHNESGLTYLTEFGRFVCPDASRTSIIVGTAGDREDTVFTALGRIAGENADRVFIKLNEKYLRGRDPDQTIDLIVAGLSRVDANDCLVGSFPGEYEATFSAIDSAHPGELVLVMCVEDYQDVIDELLRRGAREHSAIVM